MILVPLFDLKFLFEFAAGGVGTSNRRHYGSRDRDAAILPIARSTVTNPQVERAQRTSISSATSRLITEWVIEPEDT
jgi:hypothetical protein